MAKISKSGIGTNNIIHAEHLTRIIDALDGTGSAEIVATGSFTGSFTGVGYFSDMTVDNITVNQTASINYLETIYETASVIYSSGSTKFGDTADDTHNFTGIVNITGSLYVSESLTANGLTYPSTANAIKGWHLESDGNGNIVIDRARIYADVKNVSGVTLFKGTPVHVTSSVGNIDEVIAASASNALTMPATFVLAEDLADQQEGLGILTGFINGVDTSTFGEGDVVYVDYDGGYTNIKPTGSAQIQNLGIVTKAAINGSGFVYGSGRSNATPNLLNGEVFYGIGDTAVQIQLGDVISGSYFNYSGSFTGPGTNPTLQEVVDNGSVYSGTGSIQISAGTLQLTGSNDVTVSSTNANTYINGSNSVTVTADDGGYIRVTDGVLLRDGIGGYLDVNGNQVIVSASAIAPVTNNGSDLGRTTRYWDTAYITNISASLISGSFIGDGSGLINIPGAGSTTASLAEVLTNGNTTSGNDITISPLDVLIFSGSTSNILVGAGSSSFTAIDSTLARGFTFSAANDTITRTKPTQAGQLYFGAITGNRLWTLPDNTGTIALLSDIGAATSSLTLSQVLTNGNVTTGSNIIVSQDDYLGFSHSGFINRFVPDTITTSNKTQTIQNKSGTLAHLDDITNGTAATASYVLGSNVDGTVASASYAVSASYSTTASYALNAGADTNFANTNLTFTGNREHNTSGSYYQITTDNAAFGQGWFIVDPNYVNLGYGPTSLYADQSNYNVIVSGSSRIRHISTETVINDGAGDYNFRVEGTGDTTLIYADAGVNSVSIGSVASSGTKLSVVGSAATHNTGIQGTSGGVAAGTGIRGVANNVSGSAIGVVAQSTQVTEHASAIHGGVRSYANYGNSFTFGVQGTIGTTAGINRSSTAVAIDAYVGPNDNYNGINNSYAIYAQNSRTHRIGKYGIRSQTDGTMVTASAAVYTGYFSQQAVAASGSTYAMYVQNNSLSQNNYGIYVITQNGSGNNYAILAERGNIVFNEQGDSTSDFRVEGDTETHLIYANAAADAVGIGDLSPSGSRLSVKVDTEGQAVLALDGLNSTGIVGKNKSYTKQADVVTSGTSTATAASIALASGENIVIEGRVIARGSTVTVGGTFSAVAQNVAGVTAIVGSVDTSIKENSAGSPSFTVSAATNSINIDVTGGGEGLSWLVTYTYEIIAAPGA